MEAGQANSIGFIIQARYKSTRLPGKVLMELPLYSGKSVLKRITESLQKSKFYSQNIIIATSTNSENNEIELFCSKEGIHCFRGDEDDVLSRFIQISKKFGIQNIVRLTADNPFIDCSVIDSMIEMHLTKQNEYTKSKGLPLGMNIEIVQAESLQSLQGKVLTELDKEHVTYYFNHNSCNKETIEFNNKYQHLRLTIDYPSDYCLCSSLATISDYKGIEGMELVKYVDEKLAWLWEANSKNIQKNNNQDFIKELNTAEEILQSLDFIKSAEILKLERNKLTDEKL